MPDTVICKSKEVGLVVLILALIGRVKTEERGCHSKDIFYADSTVPGGSAACEIALCHEEDSTTKSTPLPRCFNLQVGQLILKSWVARVQNLHN